MARTMLFYLGFRSNPQLANGGYYRAYGQITKKRAKEAENCSYGGMSLRAFETEADYNKAIEDAKLAGYSVR